MSLIVSYAYASTLNLEIEIFDGKGAAFNGLSNRLLRIAWQCLGCFHKTASLSLIHWTESQTNIIKPGADVSFQGWDYFKPRIMHAYYITG